MRLDLALMVAGALALSAQTASAQQCVPKCRTGYACKAGQCVAVCNPPCGVGELCSAQGQCISACNPPCAANERCSPQAECVSACNPPCDQGEQCTAAGECQAVAPPPAPAPTPPPPRPPEPQAAPPLPAQGAPPAGARAGFLQAGALIGRFSYSGEWENGSTIEGSGMELGVEAAGGIQLSPKLRLGAGLQYFSMPDPEGKKDGETQTADTGKGGVVGGYVAWGGDGGLLVDGIVGYGGSGTEGEFGGWGFGLFPGIGYQSSGPLRFSVVGRVYVLATSAEHESGTFTGLQLVGSIGSF